MKRTCKRIRDTLAASGPAALRENEVAQDHLVECEECYALLEAMAELDNGLAEMVKHAIEPDYWRVPDFSVELVGHQLRVRCTSRIHRAVGEFLASMSAPPHLRCGDLLW